MHGLDLAKIVSTKKAYSWESQLKNKYTIAAIDFGIKHNILRQLESNKCDITVFPANTKADDIIDFSSFKKGIEILKKYKINI